ncbi:helix-turn-helix transcriptional regulator [Amycolatopsis sp. NPDC021455]|uniref:helix-turn-helix domain-containing protein n=1 Tax=Amycolatopsis sp. NPDC021455 TaxID=3154901 RepID=UPI0033DFCC19
MQRFAAELRKLRVDAGDPKYLSMSRRTGRSRTALAEAAGGDHLPTWETVAAFVTACDGDVHEWRIKWERARDELRPITSDRTNPPMPENPVLGSSVTATGGDQVTSGDGQPRPERRSLVMRLAPFVVTAGVAALLGAAATLVVVGNADGWSPVVAPAASDPSRAAVITVQNKVALGADKLLEDSTPSYLCQKAVPYCAKSGFKVDGTDMASGAMLVAVCHTTGPEMVNYNVNSPESKSNPHKADSALWYKVVLPDGRFGFISEVYIVEGDRGGKELTRCQQ